MEPNRFDQEIKNKLDKRVIAPSSDAWDTLSKRLDVQVEKRNNRSYWWLGWCRRRSDTNSWYCPSDR